MYTRTSLTNFAFLAEAFFANPLVGTQTVRGFAVGTFEKHHLSGDASLSSKAVAVYMQKFETEMFQTTTFVNTPRITVYSSSQLKYFDIATYVEIVSITRYVGTFTLPDDWFICPLTKCLTITSTSEDSQLILFTIIGEAYSESYFRSSAVWQPKITYPDAELVHTIKESIEIIRDSVHFDHTIFNHTFEVYIQCSSQLDPAGGQTIERNAYGFLSTNYTAPLFNALLFDWVNQSKEIMYGDLLPNITFGLAENAPATSLPIINPISFHSELLAPSGQNALTNPLQPLLGFIVEWQYCPTFAIHEAEYDIVRYYKAHEVRYGTFAYRTHRSTYESPDVSFVHEVDYTLEALLNHQITYTGLGRIKLHVLHEADYASTGQNFADTQHEVTWQSTGWNLVHVLHEIVWSSYIRTLTEFSNETSYSSTGLTFVHLAHDTAWQSTGWNAVQTLHEAIWDGLGRSRAETLHAVSYASAGLTAASTPHEVTWQSTGLANAVHEVTWQAQNMAWATHDDGYASIPPRVWITTTKSHHSQWQSIRLNRSLSLHNSQWQSVGSSSVTRIHQVEYQSTNVQTLQNFHNVSYQSIGMGSVYRLHLAQYQSIRLQSARYAHHASYQSIRISSVYSIHNVQYQSANLPIAQQSHHAIYGSIGITTAFNLHHATYQASYLQTVQKLHEISYQSFGVTALYRTHESIYRSLGIAHIYRAHTSSYQSNSLLHTLQLHQTSYQSIGLNGVLKTHKAHWQSDLRTAIQLQHEVRYASIGMTGATHQHEVAWQSRSLRYTTQTHATNYSTVMAIQMVHTTQYVAMETKTVSAFHHTHYNSLFLTWAQQMEYYQSVIETHAQHRVSYCSSHYEPIRFIHDVRYRSILRTSRYLSGLVYIARN